MERRFLLWDRKWAETNTGGGFGGVNQSTQKQEKNRQKVNLEMKIT